MKILAFILTLILSLQCFGAAPVIWKDANYARFISLLGFEFYDGKQVRTLTVDPSAGAGVAAPIGTVGLRNNAGAGETWVKSGAANTAWVNVLTGFTGWSVLGNTGLNDATNFLGTTDAQDLVFKTNATERLRISDAGAYDTTLGAGVLHSDASGILSSSSVSLTADVSGVLPVANGGTATSTQFTPGSIVFAGASGVYTQDNASFFFDDTNNRLGLLTTTPSATIGFGGDATRTIAVERNSTTNGSTLLVKAGGALSGGTDLTGGNLQLSAGISTGTGTSSISFLTSTPQTTTSSTDNATTVKMTLTGIGLLGIGTTNPGASLTITGARNGTPGATGSIFDIAPNTFTDTVTAGSGTASVFSNARVGGYTLAATNTLVTTTTAYGLRVGAVIGGTNETITNSIALGVPAGSLSGAGTITNAYGMVIVAPTGATNNYAGYFSGNVGMGAATDPQAMLDIAAGGVTVGTSEALSLRSQRVAIVSGNLIGGMSYRSNDTNLTAPGTVVAYETAVAEATHTASVLDTGIAFATTKTLAIAEKMRLDADGDLGVGITVPIAKIHQDNGTSTATAHKFTAGSTTGQTATDGFDVGITATGSAELRQREDLNFDIYTNNTARFLIENDGQIGVGSGTPAAGSIMDFFSTTQAVKLPKVATASLPTGVEGFIVYDDTKNALTYHDGTAYRNIYSGTWTSTVTAGTNAASATFGAAKYTVNGAIVSFTIRLDIDPTSAGILTSATATLPVASAFAAVNDVIGNCVVEGAQEASPFYISADVAGDRLDIQGYPATANVRGYSCTGQYTLL